MSWFLLNRNLTLLEPYDWKLSRTVLRGERGSNASDLPGKAIAKEGMADYIRYLFKTVRKFYGEAVVVTQEVDDIISSPIVKESIVNNSDCKILLDQRKYLNKFSQIQSLLGLTDKEKAQILSVNMSNDPRRKYKEVWFGLGGGSQQCTPRRYHSKNTFAIRPKRARRWNWKGSQRNWAAISNWLSEGLRKRNGIKTMKYRKCLWSMKPCFRSTGYAGSGKAAASRRPSPYSVMVVHTRLP